MWIKSWSVTLKWKVLSSNFLWCCLLLYLVSADEERFISFRCRSPFEPFSTSDIRITSLWTASLVGKITRKNYPPPRSLPQSVISPHAEPVHELWIRRWNVHIYVLQTFVCLLANEIICNTRSLEKNMSVWNFQRRARFLGLPKNCTVKHVMETRLFMLMSLSVKSMR